MDAVLFTSDEPLYLPRALRPVLRAHEPQVVIAPFPADALSQVRRQYRMLGPTAFVRYGLWFARSTTLDLLPPAAQRRLTGRFHSVPALARAHDVPVRTVRDVNAAGFVDEMRARDPDLFLSVVCGRKLGPELLSVPEAAINVHGSLLPAYRGRATAFWMLYHGEDEGGVTAHYMTDEWDAGPIVERRPFPIDPDDTMHDVYLKIARNGGELVVDLLDRWPDLPAPSPNPTTDADYYSMPAPEERREFLRRGNRFI